MISGNALVFGAEMTAFSREASGPAENWLSFQESLPSDIQPAYHPVEESLQLQSDVQ